MIKKLFCKLFHKKDRVVMGKGKYKLVCSKCGEYRE